MGSVRFVPQHTNTRLQQQQRFPLHLKYLYMSVFVGVRVRRYSTPYRCASIHARFLLSLAPYQERLSKLIGKRSFKLVPFQDSDVALRDGAESARHRPNQLSVS